MTKDESVGTAHAMPGSDGGFTMCVFHSDIVPVGAKLFLAPVSKPVTFGASATITPEYKAEQEAKNHAAAEMLKATAGIGWNGDYAEVERLAASVDPVAETLMRAGESLEDAIRMAAKGRAAAGIENDDELERLLRKWSRAAEEGYDHENHKERLHAHITALVEAAEKRGEDVGYAQAVDYFETHGTREAQAGSELAGLPDNDTVMAEVRRIQLERQRNLYVSTNACNDVMEAVRAILAKKSGGES